MARTKRVHPPREDAAGENDQVALELDVRVEGRPLAADANDEGAVDRGEVATGIDAAEERILVEANHVAVAEDHVVAVETDVVVGDRGGEAEDAADALEGIHGPAVDVEDADRALSALSRVGEAVSSLHAMEVELKSQDLHSAAHQEEGAQL